MHLINHQSLWHQSLASQVSLPPSATIFVDCELRHSKVDSSKWEAHFGEVRQKDKHPLILSGPSGK